MTTFTKDEIERVRRRHPLEQYLPARGHELRKAGQELVCRCPLHEEKSPSFSINTAKQVWTCRAGCGGGDLFLLVQKLDGIGFAEAVEKLGGVPEEGTGTGGHAVGRAEHRAATAPTEAARSSGPARRTTLFRRFTVPVPLLLPWPRVHHPGSEHRARWN